MAGEENWRTPVDAVDYFGNQRKKLTVADRRPVIRQASDLVGPGINSSAIAITDFNDILATYNGYYSAAAGMANAPKPTGSFVGITVMDSAIGGHQRFTEMASGVEYRRIFQRSPSDPETILWGAWQIASGEVPIGALMPYTGDVAPSGWLLCNGAGYAAALYPALFSVMGTKFGGSAGLFLTPDLRDRTIYGVGSAWAMGGSDGLALSSRAKDMFHIHNVAADARGSHSHAVTIPGEAAHNHGGHTGPPSGGVSRGAGGNDTAGPTHNHDISGAGAHNHGGTITSTTVGDHVHGGTTFDTAPIAGTTLRGVGMNWIVKHGVA